MITRWSVLAGSKAVIADQTVDSDVLRVPIAMLEEAQHSERDQRDQQPADPGRQHPRCGPSRGVAQLEDRHKVSLT